LKLGKYVSGFAILILLLFSFAVPAITHIGVQVAEAKKKEKKPTVEISEKTLYAGHDSFKIHIKHLDKKAKVTYSSSNKSVAAVSKKGEIKPVSAGHAIITVTIKQKNKLYISKILVTVKIPYIKITNAPAEMKAGTFYKLKAETYGTRKAELTWYTSDSSIAYIDSKSGELYAMTAGTVKVTVKDSKSGIKATVTIKIKGTAYTPPTGSDKAVYLSGLDLSKEYGMYYKTKKEEYIETTRFILFIDDGVEIPVNVIYVIDHIMNIIESKTGLRFYTGKQYGANWFTMESEIEEIFDTGANLKKIIKDDRVCIVVSQQNWRTYAFSYQGIMLQPQDIKLWDGNEHAMIHELLHVLEFRNGCPLGQVLQEGFATYYTMLITKEDTVLNGYYDGYSRLSGFEYKITEDNAEAVFNEITSGWNAYLLGFRMINYIMETYGSQAYQNMHNKLSVKFDYPSVKDVAAALKSELSKDFFRAFARWYKKNYERFGDINTTALEEWQITNGLLQKYYGSKKEVVVPNTVTMISYEAFMNNTTLENIILPWNLEAIFYCAFYGCSNLKEITIPDNVTHIGNNAFMGCSNLKRAALPKGITCIDEGTFMQCYSLENISIPEGVTDIKSYAFAYCRSFTSIILPKTIKRIGERAFSNCSNLKSIIIPDSVESIGNNAFLECSPDFTIFGNKGSYAEAYAKENNIKFVEIRY